jgi:hypothetical protein
MVHTQARDGRMGATSPKNEARYQFDSGLLCKVVPERGIEPPTFSLRIRPEGVTLDALVLIFLEIRSPKTTEACVGVD